MIANRRTTLTRAALSVLIGFGLASVALAQTAPKTPTPTPNPKATTPAATTPAKPATPPAASTAKAATPPSANDGPGAWDKVCGADAASGKQACATRFAALQPNGQVQYAVSIQKIVGQDGYSVVELTMPMGLIMPPGVSILVDGAKKSTAAFVVCIPQTPFCIAQAKGETALIDSLKKGKQLSLLGMGPDGKEAKFEVSLAGFVKALDSEGVDLAASQAKDAELNQALQKRAAEQRQKLIDEQNKATAAK